MTSILKCRTYPSDTVVVQKISFVEQKAGEPNEIDLKVNEKECVCTRIEKIDRRSTIDRTNSVKFDIGSDIKSIDADDDAVGNDNAEQSAPIEEPELNGNVSIDYTPFQNIPIPSDLKHDSTYDGSIVYRVDSITLKIPYYLLSNEFF